MKDEQKQHCRISRYWQEGLREEEHFQDSRELERESGRRNLWCGRTENDRLQNAGQQIQEKLIVVNSKLLFPFRNPIKKLCQHIWNRVFHVVQFAIKCYIRFIRSINESRIPL